MSVKQAIKKAVDNILPDGDAIVYFKDENQLSTWNRELEWALTAANALVHTYQSVSGYQLSTLADIDALIKDPEKFYRDQHMAVISVKYKEFLEDTRFEHQVNLPEKWGDVQNAIRKFAKYSNFIAQKYIEIKNGEVTATENWYLRRNSKCYLVATSKDEKARLEFAQGVIDAIEKLEPRLKQNPKIYKNALERRLWYTPLPYFLKAVNTPDGVRIIPNPLFVLSEFQGTSHLGNYIATDRELKLHRADVMRSIGDRYIKFKRHLKVGGYKLYLAREEEFAKHFDKNSDERIPGYFNKDGFPWGEPMDSSRGRTVAETTWTPFMRG
jgi:hypothetical protein